MSGSLVHDHDSFLMAIVTTIIATGDNPLTVYPACKRIGGSIMRAIEPSEYRQSFTLRMGGNGHRRSFCLPCLRHIRHQAETRGSTIPYLHLSRCLRLFQQRSGMFFLLRFVWSRLSCGSTTYALPTKWQLWPHLAEGSLPHL